MQAIAITSYQGGRLEFFKYMVDLLVEKGCSHIKVFGGGGGTILPDEIDELHAYGVARIYSPDDGRAMGLQGMIDDLLQQADFPTGKLDADRWLGGSEAAYGSAESSPNGRSAVKLEIKERIEARAIGRLISAVENEPDLVEPIMDGYTVAWKVETAARPRHHRHRRCGQIFARRRIGTSFPDGFRTNTSPSSASIPASAKPAVPCSATASA